MNTDYIYDQVKKTYANDRSGHGLDHINRVSNIALHIAERELQQNKEINVDAVQAAVYLHDFIDEKVVDDVEESKKVAKEILIQSGATIKEQEDVFFTITHMSYSKNLEKKHTLSASGQITQDADRIDSLGATGIARTFYYGGTKGRNLYDISGTPRRVEDLTEENYRHTDNVVDHFYEKLLLLADQMNTETGKEIAIKRTEYMKEFLAEFKNEATGDF